jgi:hypothetical protein
MGVVHKNENSYPWFPYTRVNGKGITHVASMMRMRMRIHRKVASAGEDLYWGRRFVFQKCKAGDREPGGLCRTRASRGPAAPTWVFLPSASDPDLDWTMCLPRTNCCQMDRDGKSHLKIVKIRLFNLTNWMTYFFYSDGSRRRHRQHSTRELILQLSDVWTEDRQEPRQSNGLSGEYYI